MSFKSRVVFLTVMIMITNLIFAAKPLERIANELGVQGENLFNEGKYKESAESFKEAILKYNEAVNKDGIPMDLSKVDTWWFYAYQAYLNDRNFEHAVEALNKRIEINPDSYDLIKDKALIYRKYLDQPMEAINILINFNKGNRNFEVEKKIGKYYADLDNFENALVWYKKAYELKKDATVIKNIASLNIKLKRNSEAIQAYENFIETNPGESDLAKTYKNMGALYEELENQEKAIEYYEKSNQLRYDNRLTLLLISKSYEIGMYDKSLEYIDLLLSNRPENDDAIYYRAMIRYEREELEAAKADFEELLSNTKYKSLAQGYIKSIESE